MSLLIACYKNILESGTVTLSAGTEDSDYPLYRVYDRDIGMVFKITAAVTMEIKVDQGASGNIAIDQLLIPEGHNLDGMTLDWQYSDNDTAYTPAVSQWVQSGSGLINKSLSSAAHRYWKFIITTPASVPQIAEIFMTPAYTWERNPSRPAGPFDDRFNVERMEDAGGHVRFLEHGDSRRYRNYQLPRAVSGQRTNIEALYDAWAGKKPFWIKDHEGNWIFGELISPLNLIEQSSNKHSFNFEFQEVLP